MTGMTSAPRPASPSSGPSLPPEVTLAVDHGADAVLVRGAAATAVLHLDGAHLTSWVPAGQDEVLWLSPLSEFGDGAAIRGGVPLVGPWFGPGRHGDRAVKHGWLRNVRWTLVSARTDGEDVELVLDSPAARSELSARLVVRVGRTLDLDLSVTVAEETEVEAALHTYLAVSDVRRVVIDGLGDAPYLDNTRGLAAARMPAGPFTPDGPTDRILEVDGPVEVHDPGTGRTVRQEPRGTARTVVWNPGQEGAAGMADVPDDGWTGFVCVEPALAKDAAVRLPAGGTLRLGVTYSLRG